MEKIRYVAKQWTVKGRDILKSLFYGAVVPALVTIQGVIEAGGISDIDWSLIFKISLGSIIAHIIRKLTEPTKLVEVTKLSADDNDDRTNPPPLGDPTHPKK